MAGAYEKLLLVLGYDLDSPYWEREAALENLTDKLTILEDARWLDHFLAMTDLYDSLEQSCWYEDQKESWVESGELSGYEAGYESAMDRKDEDALEKIESWIDKLKAFLTSKTWIGLNRKQTDELDDWLNSYPLEV